MIVFKRNKHLNLIIYTSAVCLLILVLFNISCSSQSTMKKDDKLIVKGFASRLSTNINGIDSTEKVMVKEGLYDIGEFLFSKDKDAFIELNKKCDNINQPKKLIDELFSENFLQLSTDFYEWTDQRVTPVKYEFQKIITPHFIIYYPSIFPNKEIVFIANESENIFEGLNGIFKPDKNMSDNFKRLAIYESWQNLNFKEKSGKLFLTNGKIPIIITRTNQEMKDLADIQQAEKIGGLTTFSLSLSTEKSQVWFPCRININYSTPLSLVALTHEITHAFTSVIYSNPEIIDSALAIAGRDSFPEVSKKLGLKVLYRLNVLTIEGPAYWTQWSLGLFSKIGLLPTAAQIVSNFDEKPNLKKLLNSDLDISIFTAIFGDPSKELGVYFTSLGSFIGYLVSNYSPEKLYVLFASGSKDIGPDLLEKTLGKPFNQIENEWKNFIKNNNVN